MAEIWCRYLPDVTWQDIPELLRTHGVKEADNQGVTAWILHTAALLRLAHASLDVTSEREALSGVSLGTLSRTLIKTPRGRPKTARWAFWTGVLMRTNLRINGKPPTNDLVTDLIKILLRPRRVTPEEVRTVFVELRREVTRSATEAAREILTTTLKAGVNEKTFVQPYKDLEKVLAPDSQMRPMVKDGKLDKEWLKTLTKTRRGILRRARKHGPLGGEPPIMRLDHSADIGSWTIGGLSRRGGTVHLGKGIEAPVPGIPLEGCLIGISFSRNFLESEPFASQLYAVPAWWSSWHSLFVAVPAKP